MDNFEVKDVTYDGPMGCYTFRIRNKESGNIERVTTTPELGHKFGSKYMSFFSEGSKLGYTEILELNDLYDNKFNEKEQGISLKAIYKTKERIENHDMVKPIKILYKNHDENKWKTLAEPSDTMLNILYYWRAKLEKRKEKITVNESPLLDQVKNSKRLLSR